MRLFKIQSDENAPVYFFPEKRLAKAHRDDLHAQGKKGVVIMRGPDHWRGESYNITRNTRRNRRTRR